MATKSYTFSGNLALLLLKIADQDLLKQHVKDEGSSEKTFPETTAYGDFEGSYLHITSGS